MSWEKEKVSSLRLGAPERVGGKGNSPEGEIGRVG